MHLATIDHGMRYYWKGSQNNLRQYQVVKVKLLIFCNIN